MFGTIIKDAYKKDEARDIAFALDDLCNPNDTYGWASSGIYCYWNYVTHEVLYIGLAIDLTQRFKQHNGLASSSSKGNKIDEISDYFEENEKIGFSIFVQSPLNQAVTSRNIYQWFGYDPEKFRISDFSRESLKEDLRRLEGILIESYRINKGDLPRWNKVSGSKLGQQSVMKRNYRIVDDMVLNRPSLLISKSSLRELSVNPTYAYYESFLHGIRQMMLAFGMSFNEALPHILQVDTLKTYKKIQEENYLRKELKI